MTQTAATVLKHSQVNVTGAVQIGSPTGAAAVPSGPASMARIVEQESGQAVIEIICGCGNKIYLHCRYADTPGDAPVADPNAAGRP